MVRRFRAPRGGDSGDRVGMREYKIARDGSGASRLISIRVSHQCHSRLAKLNASQDVTTVPGNCPCLSEASDP